MKSSEEVNEVSTLRAEVRRLKESLADVYLDLQIEKQLSLILLKEAGRDRDDVKKNIPGRLLTRS
jgi:hypothetical protein